MPKRAICFYDYAGWTESHRAGIQVTAPITIHTFRKSFGQNHADVGTPIHVLQQLMGHASITTTREFYLQASDADDRDAVARYEALLNGSGKLKCIGRIGPRGVSLRKDNSRGNTQDIQACDQGYRE